MKAEIISVGTELLLGQIVNSNFAYLAEKLAGAGIKLYRQVTVGDNLGRLSKAIADAWKGSDLVIITGGLGPTDDDLTREGIAEALGLNLEKREELVEGIDAYFKRLHRKMSPNNLKQALFPRGAEPIHNPAGTAPGIFLQRDNRVLVALPGVPREMEQMFEEEVLPRLKEIKGDAEVIYSRIIRVTGIGESSVAEQIRDIINEQSNPTIALLAGGGEIKIRLSARTRDQQEARKLIAPWEERIKKRLGNKIYGFDGETLEEKVNSLLKASGKRLAVAESCTGGLLGHRLTQFAGSSKYFIGGVIAYSNKIKEEVLSVPKDVIQNKGAVSSETARLMARGIAEKFSCDLGLGITGIAGPGGGTPEKPVGLVYIGLAARTGSAWFEVVEKCYFNGPRGQIKHRSTQKALDMLRLYLIDNNN